MMRAARRLACRPSRRRLGVATILITCALAVSEVCRADEPTYRIGTFSVDITVPLDHRLMGILPTKSKTVADPLYARGFVLTGGDSPIVYVAIDWCEIRNAAYDQWREELADAAGTSLERVLVSCLHQHDAPVVDLGAAQLLDGAGLTGELYDALFHDRAIDSAANALRQALKETQPVTHLGTGQAKVEQVASNRRVIGTDGKPNYSRGSRSGAEEFHALAPDGEIDPFLKTISFWNNDTPLVAWSTYATHPMSYYGQGEVSSDFVGLARQKRQEQDPDVFQIYSSGCSGDITAGKYNDGSPENRTKLVERMVTAMEAAWKATKRVPLKQVAFRNTELRLDYSPSPFLSPSVLREQLENDRTKTEDRIHAAMGLSSNLRVSNGQTIDFPCVDFGPAQVVVFPGESFVHYQLMAQQMRPDSFVVSIGYGECWPGYVPTEAAFQEGFADKWLWVGPGVEEKIREALEAVLLPPE